MANELADREYAERLQQKDDQIAMMNSDPGKAILLVEDIISLVRLTNEALHLKQYKIESVSYDDMVYFAEQTLGLQAEFAKKKHPTKVDVGYHYTNEDNLPRIRSHGLLTKSDRASKNVSSLVNNGSTFGDGVYTSNNPEAFQGFGNVGIIVGRLQGKTARVKKCLSPSTKIDGVNTIIGDKMKSSLGRKFDSNGWPVDDHYNEVVLRTSKQCLPMIRYNVKLLTAKGGKECILNMEKSLKDILGKCFKETPQYDADSKPLSTINSAKQSSREFLPGSAVSVPSNKCESLKSPPSLVSQSSGNLLFGSTPSAGSALDSASKTFGFTTSGLPSASAQPLNFPNPANTFGPGSYSFGCTASPMRLSKMVNHRKLLTDFYMKYNRDKLVDVEMLLEMYKGNEEAMFAKLALKYNTSNPLKDKPSPIEFERSSGMAFGCSASSNPVLSSAFIPKPSFSGLAGTTFDVSARTPGFATEAGKQFGTTASNGKAARATFSIGKSKSKDVPECTGDGCYLKVVRRYQRKSPQKKDARKPAGNSTSGFLFHDPSAEPAKDKAATSEKAGRVAQKHPELEFTPKQDENKTTEKVAVKMPQNDEERNATENSFATSMQKMKKSIPSTDAFPPIAMVAPKSSVASKEAVADSSPLSEAQMPTVGASVAMPVLGKSHAMKEVLDNCKVEARGEVVNFNGDSCSNDAPSTVAGRQPAVSAADPTSCVDLLRLQVKISSPESLLKKVETERNNLRSSLDAMSKVSNLNTPLVSAVSTNPRSPTFFYTKLHFIASTVLQMCVVVFVGTYAMSSVFGAIAIHITLQLTLNILNGAKPCVDTQNHAFYSINHPSRVLKRTLSGSNLYPASYAPSNQHPSVTTLQIPSTSMAVRLQAKKPMTSLIPSVVAKRNTTTDTSNPLSGDMTGPGVCCKPAEKNGDGGRKAAESAGSEGITSNAAGSTDVCSGGFSFGSFGNKRSETRNNSEANGKIFGGFLSSNTMSAAASKPLSILVATEREKKRADKDSASSSCAAFPPMSATAPTPLSTLAANERKNKTTDEASASSSCAAFPQMAATAPKGPFSAKPSSNSSGFTPKDSSSSCAAYPPMSLVAPKSPFSTKAFSNNFVLAASSCTAFAPMSATALKSPFLTKASSKSSGFPPMSAAAPTPFGGFKKNKETMARDKASSSSTCAAFPHMAAAAPNPLGIKPSSISVGFSPMPTGAAKPFGGFPKKEETKAMEAPVTASMNFLALTFSYQAPLVLTNDIPANALSPPPLFCDTSKDCVVCHDKLANYPTVALARCQHVFHRECIERAFQMKPQCPVCRKNVGAPQGKQPSGIMTVSIIPITCFGFKEDTIRIKYAIPSGTQMNYHDEPGQSHGGKNAVAFLPNNDDGRAMLKRFIYAFMHGITFGVGTSLTTGKKNQCTWASIHHKTSTEGGVRKHGYPDPTYFANCNSELDSLGVPLACDLGFDGTDCSQG